MLTKYDTNYFTKDKKVHSVVLASLHFRSASLQSASSQWKRLVISVSLHQGVNVWFGNVGKLEHLPIQQALFCDLIL